LQGVVFYYSLSHKTSTIQNQNKPKVCHSRAGGNRAKKFTVFSYGLNNSY